MMITEESKSVIPFRPGDAKRVGEGCFYIDQIIWLNRAEIELGDRVGFNFGCYVNGYGGLEIGDRTIIGPYSMIHTANHLMDTSESIQDQGWTSLRVELGPDCWIGMGVSIMPGITIGAGAVIGGGSVVAKDIPAWSIAVGNPAKAIKARE